MANFNTCGVHNMHATRTFAYMHNCNSSEYSPPTLSNEGVIQLCWIHKVHTLYGSFALELMQMISPPKV